MPMMRWEMKTGESRSSQARYIGVHSDEKHETLSQTRWDVRTDIQNGPVTPKVPLAHTQPSETSYTHK